MPALGGTTTRVTPAGGQFSIAGWRGRTAPTFVDRFRIIGPSVLTIPESVLISVLAVDQDGVSRPPGIPITMLDTGIAVGHQSEGDTSRTRQYVLRGVRSGTVRLAASIPGWRYDTLAVRVGNPGQFGLTEDFRAGIAPQRWLALGVPLPFVKLDGDGTPALFPNGDFQWQSGLLSRESVSLKEGVDVSAVFSAPFSGRPLPAALLELSLVAEPRDRAIDRVAPQFTNHVALAWDGEASRFTYSVGAESKSDPVPALGGGLSHVVHIAVNAHGEVAFSVDDRVRWTSSLRFLGGLNEPRARIWLGGRATGSWASIRDLKVIRR